MTTPKSKQINIRLTPEQETLLRQYCVRNGLSTAEAVIAMIARVIPGFTGGDKE